MRTMRQLAFGKGGEPHSRECKVGGRDPLLEREAGNLELTEWGFRKNQPRSGVIATIKRGVGSRDQKDWPMSGGGEESQRDGLLKTGSHVPTWRRKGKEGTIARPSHETGKISEGDGRAHGLMGGLAAIREMAKSPAERGWTT